LAARFLVQSRTEIGWDIASPLAGAPRKLQRPIDYGRARNDFIKDRIYLTVGGFDLPTKRPPPWPRIDHSCA
jgi:hypothetical protein